MSSSLRRLLTCVCHWDSEGSLVADDPAHPYNPCQAITIDDLPDDVLLATFDFYVVEYHPGLLKFGTKGEVESWQSLVHVCRRWRDLVFASPRRLNLRLWCTPERSARMSLDVWPALPLIIFDNGSSADNEIAGLEHSDRIQEIKISIIWSTTHEVEKLWTAMQVPFPELTSLYLVDDGSSSVPSLPDSFLGGSAPRLRYLGLISISFPGIPKLILSATHLIHLFLSNIPHSGYFSPEAMATCLSAQTSLELLELDFESPESCPDLESQPPFLPTRSVLPSLTVFRFKGASEYLEQFLALIDAPQVYTLSIMLFNDIHFDTLELTQFISRTPTLGAYDEASLIFNGHEAIVRLLPQPVPSDDKKVQVKILCSESDWQLSFLAQICTSSLRLLLTMENLYIYEKRDLRLKWKDDIEDTEWLDLLHPFSAVKNLYLSWQFAPHIAPALQKLTEERTTEVLPALQNLFLGGFQPSEPVQEGIARFISARQLINRPVVISIWDRRDESEESEVDD